MYEHHDGPDGAAGLEKEDPAAVEEEEDGEAELDRVAGGLDVMESKIMMIISDQLWPGVDGPTAFVADLIAVWISCYSCARASLSFWSYGLRGAVLR